MKEPAIYHERDFQLTLLNHGTREQIIQWLVWNDPNGTYTDRDSGTDDMNAITLEVARIVMRDQISRS
ncbi:MAG TPA: hypothetical protein VHR66_04395 [Gemmataceae bacterium]|jgi:hypothetical protein|nr:hypothetical protein [Gemmataceae bacterium]